MIRLIATDLDGTLLRSDLHSIATANAHPEVIAAVDEVTASNDDDGVAVAIERLIVVAAAIQ